MFIYETVNNFLEKSFEKYSSNEAIVYPEQGLRYTYKEVKERIDLLGRGLIAVGASKNDHIAILAPSSPDWIMFFLAITKIGAVPVCLNDKNTLNELEYTINHSDSVILITSNLYSSYLDLDKFPKLKRVINISTENTVQNDRIIDLTTLEQKALNVSAYVMNYVKSRTSYDDILTIQYTSGTTGAPKAVMSVHYRVLSNVKIFLDNFGYTEYDTLLSALPLYHVMGCLYTGLLSLMCGSRLILISEFKTRKVLKIIEDEQCTTFHGVPTMYNFMLNYFDKFNIHSLKKGMLAGDYCNSSTIEKIIDVMHMDYVFSCYGQSEGVGYTQSLMTDAYEKRVNTVGRPVKGVQIKIVDDEGNTLPAFESGEILVKMPFCMAGYYKNIEATKKTIIDGWIHTGDIGYLDNDGYLSVKGRKKDIIIRGGENISPSEIEDTLKNNEHIKDVVIVGVPDALMGEEIAAFIIPSDDSSNIDRDTLLEDINKYTTQHLSKYKVPKYTMFVNNFPMTESGKVQKFKLRQILHQ